MALDGGVALDIHEEDGPRTRGLGAIWTGAEAERQPLPLASVSIAASVADRIAEVTVTQVFRNTFSDPIEAVYTFPLDGGCVVSRFEMQAGERTLHGVIRERAQARQDYQQALDEGKRAALLEQERDDVFTIQLGNLPPGENATIRLTYSEELSFFDSGLTELRLPLVVGIRYIAGEPLPGASAGHGTEGDTTVVPDASRITPPRLADGFDPAVHLAITVDIAGDAPSDLTCSQHATRIGAAGGHTTISLARADERLNRDFVLRWRVAAAGEIRPSLHFYRRPSGDRYGIVSLGVGAGPGESIARDIVFLLDRSGSMKGSKMASAARACALLLGTLGPADRFALVAFSGRPQWLVGDGGANSLVTADRNGIARGEHLLRDVQADGGTELFSALQGALDLLAGRRDAAGRVPVVVLITDGEVGDESRALALVQRAGVRVFTVGVDTSVNSGLLKRIAQAGRGTFVLTEPGAGLDRALEAIAREIGAPMIENLTIAVDGGAITDVAPERLPDLFAGRAATIAFRAEQGSIVRVSGRRADGTPFVLEVSGREVDLPAIAHLWARRRLTDLEDRYRLARTGQPAMEAEIIALSTSHGVLSRFTAFLVVDDRQAVVSTADRRTIVQPVEMPHLWAAGVPLSSMSRISPVTMADWDMLAAAPRELLSRRMAGTPGASMSRAAGDSVPPAAPATPTNGILSERDQRADPHPPIVRRDIDEQVDRLVPILHEIAGGSEDPERYSEALRIVDRLLAMLAASRPNELRALARTLERLRDHLAAATHRPQEIETVSRELWEALEQAGLPPRRRFWDTV